MRRYLLFVFILMFISCEERHNGMLYYPLYDTEEFSLPDSGVSSIQFFNSDQGWIVSRGKVYRTIDGCRTWEMITPDTLVHVNKIFFIDMEHGWCYERYGRIYYYNGEGWELSIETGDTATDGNTISFYSREEGWCRMERERLWHYHDGRWDTVPGIPVEYAPFCNLEPVAPGEVIFSNFCSLAPPVVIHYRDGVFKIDTIPCDTIGSGYSRFLFIIDFTSPEEGWGIGVRGNYPYPGHIYRYRDGKWEPYLLMSGILYPKFMKFISPDNGWIGGVGIDEYFFENNHEWLLLHWDGDEWHIYYLPEEYGFSSAFVSDEYIWLGSGDKIIRLNISNWR